MRIHKWIIVGVLILFLFGMAVNQFSLKVAADNFQGVQVKYSKSVFSRFLVNKGDRFAVHFGSGTGTFTAVGMLPNGSPVFLGYYHGDGSFHVSMKAVFLYARIWEEHLRHLGLDPGSVNPGMLFLGVVRKDNGTYSTAFAVPIRVDKVLEGYAVKVSVSAPMLRLSQSSLKPIENRTMGVESIWNDSDNWVIDRNDEILLDSVIPNRIDDGCYGSICFYWAPDGKTLSYGINTTIPLVIAHIWGKTDIRDSGLLRMFMATESSSGVSISFSSLGAENYGGSVIPVSAGPVFTLKKQGKWLEHYTHFFGRDLPDDEDSYVMSGIVGHYAVVRFRLYEDAQDETGTRLVEPTKTRAFFTIAVPVLEKTPEGARIKAWDGIFGGDNGSRLVEKVRDIENTFETYRNYTFTGQFHVDTWQLRSESHYTPLFSMGVSVDDLGLMPVAGFSIGMSSDDTSFLEMNVAYKSWNKDQKFKVTAYKLKDLFLYLRDKKSYVIPVMYVDIYEIPKYGPTLPINPHHPVYPVN
ncbi:hypothetical protein [Thermococcus sp.]|uniref:hypothetical protein n=2 Tax=Thermococcus sp. TaxID=35749 RepID=UPI00261A55BC|nr:hypothetical protein [Thermococcus sp.]